MDPPPVLPSYASRFPPRGNVIPNPSRSAAPACGGSLLAMFLLKAALDGDLPRVMKVVRGLNVGRGRLLGKVEAARDSMGFNALHHAVLGGSLPVCKYLVEELRMDVNPVDSVYGETPLTAAIATGNFDVVRYLLDHGANPEKLNKAGVTPLHFAAGEGKCEAVEILLAKGAYIDALTSGGTALHNAAHNRQDHVVKILLDHHADPNKTDCGVHTPLLIAIRVGALKCVQLLLEAGANVQGIVGKDTPLMVAAAIGSIEIMTCLVSSGADPNARDHFGHTPIEIAALYNRRIAVEVLFPVTSRIPSVRDWCVEGIISYAKSMPLKDKVMYKKRLASGKNQEYKEFKSKEYLAAIKIYTVERAEIEAARLELAKRVASRIAFMKRNGYPCTVGKPKQHLTPSGTDPRVLLDPSRQPNTDVPQIDRPVDKNVFLATEKVIWNAAMRHLKAKGMDQEYDLIPDNILLYPVVFDDHTWYHCNILGRRKDIINSTPSVFFVEVQCKFNEVQCAKGVRYDVKACVLLDSESCYKCNACPPSSDILHPVKGGFACGIQEDQAIFCYSIPGSRIKTVSLK